MVADNLAPTGGEDSSAQVIDVDITCVSCDYNLRGLTDENMCPECGLPVQATRVGIMVVHGNAKWIRRLRRGVLMLPISVIIGVIAVTMLIVLTAQDAPSDESVEMMCITVVVGAYALTGYGLVTITQRQPFSELLQVKSWMRLVVRLAGYLVLAYAMSTEIYVVVNFEVESMVYLLGAMGLSMPVIWMFALHYLASLVPLMPDRGLNEVLRKVQWQGLACLFVPVVVGGVFTLLTLADGAVLMFALWVVLIILIVPPGMDAMARYLGALRAAAECAEEYHGDSSSTS